MAVHGPGGVDGVGRVPELQPGRVAKTPPPPTAGGEPVDQVQISTEARLKVLLTKVPEVRQDLIDRVRAEIEAGTYETEEKMDIAIGRLLEDLKEK